MTYRERRERRQERLEGWAEKREAASSAGLERSRELASAIPFGQPILVGHHSERRDRNYRAKIAGAMDRAVADGRKAADMSSRADGISRQLRGAIYSDDPDALEQLRARIAERTAERDAMKERNKAARAAHKAELAALTPYQRDRALPHPSYEVRNLTADIGRQRKRLERLEREAEHGPADRVITARFSSSCETCGAPLEKGAAIRYNRAQGARCVTCPE